MIIHIAWITNKRPYKDIKIKCLRVVFGAKVKVPKRVELLTFWHKHYIKGHTVDVKKSDTLGIWLPNMLGIQMINNCLVVKWSGIQMLSNDG